MWKKGHLPDLECCFSRSGFPWENGPGKCFPCGVAYSKKCFRAGPPFGTRLEDGKGLSFPNITGNLFPNFVCEACQVRAQLDRELQKKPSDVQLLQFERMRQVDTANRWADKTVSKYSGQIRRLERFSATYQVETLRPGKLLHPSRSPSIALAWAQLEYTLQPGTKEGTTVAYNTSRQLRSAASHFYAWDMQMQYPERLMTDLQGKHLVLPYVSPTEEVNFSLFNAGMAIRLGTDSQPSWTLRHCHIKRMNDVLEQAWQHATTDKERHDLAAAGASNLTLALGGLRGGENFSLRYNRVSVIHPTMGPAHGLPSGIGFIQMYLGDRTKSSATTIAEVVISYYTASGLNLGMWMERLMSFEPVDGVHLFSTPNRRRWSSSYWRKTYAWPILEDMRAEGHPSLMAFTDVIGHRIQDKVWSCHSWRRFLDTFLQKHHVGLNHRRATLVEIYEHLRWSKKRKDIKEPMHIHYSDLTLGERVSTTLFCC